MCPHRITWIKTKREGVNSRHFGALKQGKLGWGCKANKCSDAGTGDLGALLMFPQVQLSKRLHAMGTREGLFRREGGMVNKDLLGTLHFIEET